MTEVVSDLRGVFDLCNPDSTGYILTEYLAGKLATQFNDHKLNTIQGALDPHHKGRISFEEFCHAIEALQSGNNPAIGSSEPHLCAEDDDSSDPENTYNEYDLPEDESLYGEMENFEAVGESTFNLSPIRSSDPSDEFFNKRGSLRKSHRSARSWNLKEKNDIGPIMLPVPCEETSSITSEYDDLSEKVDILKDHVTRLSEEKNLQAQYEMVKHENLQLTHQVNELEEKLQDMTERAEEIKQDSRHKLQDLQREHKLQSQVFQSRIEILIADKERIENELLISKNNIKESRETLSNFQNKTSSLTRQLMETNEEYRRLNQRFALQQDRHAEQQRKLQEETNSLHSQIEIIKQEKIELETRMATTNVDDPLASRLKAKLDNFQTENDALRVTNEDLMLQLSEKIADARALMCGDGHSIAQELSNASKDEVLEALKKQEEINEQLRNYLDRITLNILERDPGILEIK